MSIPFAKIFESEKHGQMLVIKGKDDEGNPAVIVSVMPDSLGLCSASICFEDNDTGWEQRDTTFDLMDEVAAEDAASRIFCMAEDFTEKAENA